MHVSEPFSGLGPNDPIDLLARELNVKKAGGLLYAISQF
jgi:hypothetical protein